MRKGKEMGTEEIKIALSYIPKAARDSTMENKTIWHDALTKISIDDREYYLSLLRKGIKLNAAPTININTVHGVKGGEADNVALMTDMSWRCYNGYDLNPDTESRVFYVGATRARQNLVIIKPETQYFYPIWANLLIYIVIYFTK